MEPAKLILSAIVWIFIAMILPAIMAVGFVLWFVVTAPFYFGKVLARVWKTHLA
jgi:hypothetical protein